MPPYSRRAVIWISDVTTVIRACHGRHTSRLSPRYPARPCRPRSRRVCATRSPRHPVQPFDDAAPPARATDRGIPAPARKPDGEATGGAHDVPRQNGPIPAAVSQGGALDRVRGLRRVRPYVDGFGQAVAPHQATQLQRRAARSRLASTIRRCARDAGQNRNALGAPRAARAKNPVVNRKDIAFPSCFDPHVFSAEIVNSRGERSAGASATTLGARLPTREETPHRLTGSCHGCREGRAGMVAGDAGTAAGPRAAGDRRLATGWGCGRRAARSERKNGRAPDDGAARPIRAVAATLATPGDRAHLGLLHRGLSAASICSGPVETQRPEGAGLPPLQFGARLPKRFQHRQHGCGAFGRLFVNGPPFLSCCQRIGHQVQMPGRASPGIFGKLPRAIHTAAQVRSRLAGSIFVSSRARILKWSAPLVAASRRSVSRRTASSARQCGAPCSIVRGGVHRLLPRRGSAARPVQPAASCIASDTAGHRSSRPWCRRAAGRSRRTRPGTPSPPERLPRLGHAPASAATVSPPTRRVGMARGLQRIQRDAGRLERRPVLVGDALALPVADRLRANAEPGAENRWPQGWR